MTKKMIKVTLYCCCKCKKRAMKDLKKLKGVEKVEYECGYIVVTGNLKLDDILEEAECSSHSSLKCWEDITPPPPKEDKQESLIPYKFDFPASSSNVFIYINNMLVHYHGK